MVQSLSQLLCFQSFLRQPQNTSQDSSQNIIHFLPIDSFILYIPSFLACCFQSLIQGQIQSNAA